MFGAVAKLAGGALAGKAVDKVFTGILGKAGADIFDQAKGLFDKLPNQGIFDQFNSLFQKFPIGILPFPSPISFDNLFPGIQTPDKPFMPVSSTACQTVGSPGLTTNGSDTIDTGDYEILMKEDEVLIREKGSNKWIRIWGDPHVVTSDGDKAGFTKDNLTIDLPDGTKITIKPTAEQGGVSFVDAVAVMKGEDAVVANGFHDGVAGVNVGNVLKNAAAVDRMWADGTVLATGAELDDLISTATGLEILGTDPGQRFQEHQLDGLGGRSRIDTFGNADSMFGTESAGHDDGIDSAAGNDGAQGVGATSNNFISGGIFGLLLQVAQQLTERLADRASTLRDTMNAQPKAPDRNDPDFMGPDGKLDQDKYDAAMKQYDEESLKWEGDLKQLQAEVQRLQNFVDQMFETATRLQKASHDSSMSIIRNFSN